jgi:biotin synthase
MPNLSPLHVREQYMLYNNKIATGLEAAEGVKKLAASIANIGYELVHERGDCKI